VLKLDLGWPSPCIAYFEPLLFSGELNTAPMPACSVVFDTQNGCDCRFEAHVGENRTSLAQSATSGLPLGPSF
jgi:hypothetical protein